MLYTEYFTLRDCSGFLQIRSQISAFIVTETGLKSFKCLKCVIFILKKDLWVYKEPDNYKFS